MNSTEPGKNDAQKPARVTAAPGDAAWTLHEAMTGRASPAKAAIGGKPVFAYIASLPQPQRGGDAAHPTHATTVAHARGSIVPSAAVSQRSIIVDSSSADRQASREPVVMPDFPLPATWDRTGFKAVGFQGFVPLVGLDIDSLLHSRGVYAVFGSLADEKPAFLEDNPIRRRKPYTLDKLSMKWLPAQTVVYTGKAQAVDGISGRLCAFIRKSSRHAGGRALWQLCNAHDLVAAWAETPEHVAEIVEKSYLRSFKGQYGRYPFANWRL